MGYSSTIKFFFPVMILAIYHQAVFAAGTRSTSSTLVAETCKRAAESNPSLNYDFCVTTLQSSSKSANADLRWLGIITTSLAKAKATYGGKKIEVLLAKTQSPYDKARLSDCKKMYAEAWSSTKQAKYAFKTNNAVDANLHMGNALTNAVACEDSWKEQPGHVSPITNDNYSLEQLCRIGLAISKFLPSAN